MYLKYFGNKFELGTINKIASIVNDKLIVRERLDFQTDFAEIAFNKLMEEKKYPHAAQYINKDSHINKGSFKVPEHRINDIYNGLLDMYIISRTETSKNESYDSTIRNYYSLAYIRDCLGNIPPKLEVAFIITDKKPFLERNNRGEYRFLTNNNFSKNQLLSNTIDTFKKPQMIEVFMKEMEDCFKNLNSSYKNKDFETILSDISILEGDDKFNYIDNRIKMVNRFMELSILIDEYQLSSINMKQKFIDHIDNYLTDMKKIASNVNSYWQDYFLITLGYNSFDEIKNFANNFNKIELTQEEERTNKILQIRDNHKDNHKIIEKSNINNIKV